MTKSTNESFGILYEHSLCAFKMSTMRLILACFCSHLGTLIHIWKLFFKISMHMFLSWMKKILVINKHTEYERKWTLEPVGKKEQSCIMEMTCMHMSMELWNCKTTIKYHGQTSQQYTYKLDLWKWWNHQIASRLMCY